MIFGKDIVKCCGMCGFSVSVAGTDTYICPKKGAVTGNFKCRHFKYDPMKKTPVVTYGPTDYSKQDFTL